MLPNDVISTIKTASTRDFLKYFNDGSEDEKQERCFTSQLRVHLRERMREMKETLEEEEAAESAVTFTSSPHDITAMVLHMLCCF